MEDEDMYRQKENVYTGTSYSVYDWIERARVTNLVVGTSTWPRYRMFTAIQVQICDAFAE